jgi:hypothetical protein
MNALVKRCRQAGILLSVEGADLRCDAPRGAMTPDLITGLKANKLALLEELAPPNSTFPQSDRPEDGDDLPDGSAIPPLPPAAEARRQKVLAIQARDGTHYAVLVEDPNTDPVIAALATPDGTCELLIPKDRYDPFAIAATVAAWNQEEDL